MELVPGLYETVVDDAVVEAMRRLEPLVAATSPLDRERASSLLAAHVHDRLLERLTATDLSVGAQVEIANAALAAIESDRSVELPAEVLQRVGAQLLQGQRVAAPIIPLSAPDLLVNAPGQPHLLAALKSEIPSADSIDILVSFLKWRGVQELTELLEACIADGVRVRVLTTTYMGASDARAAEMLADIGAEIRVSYDTNRTRLHAKAWLLHRRSGYSTAYVGSSNISHQALTAGLEWNVRLAEPHAPGMLDKIRTLMDSYWESPEFVEYEADRFAQAIERQKLSVVSSAGPLKSPTLALAAEPAASWDDGPYRPNPFQVEMLEDLERERLRHDRWKNLVVAATGIGKTVIAAIDYWRLHELDDRFGRQPTLLFVAHRRELLESSRSTFRRAGADPAFGELMVGGARPDAWRHVFGSIQSLSAMNIEQVRPDHFDVVIVDEFHHSEAPTYTRILEHLQPKLLLGLTATPERTDGQSVTHWFGGHTATEYRLWDALQDELLAPFHYYGINDETDLSQVAWRSGGYVTSELENVLTGDVIRARRVVKDLRRIVADVGTMRAIAFCVSVKHAEFMAGQFAEAGIAAVALTGQTESDDRRSALARLQEGSLQIVCAVDILNEGVDIPKVDTILFLRPTESATVFLQQLGRGLRLAPGKAELTVLDFVGQQHQQFRFDLRYRALTGATRTDLIEQVEEGFPHLPPGVHIELDRQVSERVLSSIRTQLRPNVLNLERELTHLNASTGRPSLVEFLDATGFDVDDLHRGSVRGWVGLQRRAGFEVPSPGPDEANVAKRLGALLHADDAERLSVWRGLLTGEVVPQRADVRQRRIGQMLLSAIYGEVPAAEAPEKLLADLLDETALVAEILETIPLLDRRSQHRQRTLTSLPEVPLAIHAHYTRREIMAAFDFLDRAWREGVRYDESTNTDLFAYTLDKSKGQYSPTTLYADVALSPRTIQWESQSATSRTSRTGRRYLERSSRVLLFQRPDNHAPYLFLGPAELQDATGDRPIRCIYRLQIPMPESVFHQVRVAG